MSCTGDEKLASRIFFPTAFNMMRTGARARPTMTLMPALKVPSVMISVAAIPRFWSRCASITYPSAGFEASALYPSSSATMRMRSRRSSMPTPVFADIAAHGTSPPSLSRYTPCSIRVLCARSTSAFGLSILLMATMKGIAASLMLARASSVCAFTPSSAATTSIAMSAARAPRCRMAVNAAWPGVSMNVIRFFTPSEVEGFLNSLSTS